MSSGFTHESAAAETVEWYTPGWLFEQLGLEFDLDPCHPEGERLPWVPALFRYTKQDDGLASPWFGRVWLNPPYGRETERWLARMHEHRNGIALVFARTDTNWFHRHVAAADGVLFLNRRIQFVGRNGNPRPGKDGKVSSPGCGSMLVAWGRECREALIYATQDGGLGTFVHLS